MTRKRAWSPLSTVQKHPCKAIWLATASLFLVGFTTGIAGATLKPTSGSYRVLFDAPFTGPTSVLAVHQYPTCLAATELINKAGGVLGKKLGCLPVNNYGDPADAVPALVKAFATTKSIVMAAALTSTTAATTIPIVEKQHIPFFTDNGLVSYIKQSNPYFWRMAPSDNDNGASFSLAVAHILHKKKVAIIVTSSIASTGARPGMTVAAKRLHLDVTQNLVIPANQASYSSTVARLIASKPQALIFTASAQTSITFLSNYYSLAGKNMPPIVSGTANLVATYVQALKKVLPVSYITKKILFVGASVTSSQLAFKNWMHALSVIHEPKTYPASLDVLVTLFTGINIMALAMDMAHSAKGPVYNKDIMKITAGGPKAVKVFTYAEGLHELKRHKAIQYVGASGRITFDKSHNAAPGYALFHVTATGGTTVVGYLSGTSVQSVAGNN